MQADDQTLTLIPYYAWCHRGSGKMRVWLPQDLNATNPSQPATLASESKVSSSTEKMPALSAINDRLVPKDENDRSVPYTHWWPKNGTTEWLGYEFQRFLPFRVPLSIGTTMDLGADAVYHSHGVFSIRTPRDNGSL